MDWSYDLLELPERALLRRLSVFAGGWTLKAAEAVAGNEVPADVLDSLTQLVDKSLVVLGHDPGVERRYRQLETLRHYALEKLYEAGEDGESRGLHLRYFLDWVGRVAPALTGPEQVTWLNRVEAELDNVRAALEWALEADVEAGLQVAGGLARFWDARGRSREAIDWLEQLLGRAGPRSPARPRALAVQGSLWVTQSALARARSAAEESLALFRAVSDISGQAYCLLILGQVLFTEGDVVSARPLVDQSLGLYQDLGDRLGQADALSWLSLDRRDPDWARAQLEESLRLSRGLGHVAGIAGSLVGLAQIAYWAGDYAGPVPWLEEAMTLQRQLGSKSGMAWVSEMHGNLAFRQGDYGRARACYEESIALNEEAGQSLGCLWARVNLAHIALREGQAAPARRMLEESLRKFREAQIHIGVVYSAEGLASLAARQGRPDGAAQLFAWAEAMREVIGDRRPPVEQAEVEKDLARVRAQLDQAAFRKAWGEGLAMQAAPLDQVIERALAASD
jgi:tetratricopeptide (TPR) repeat protein